MNIRKNKLPLTASFLVCFLVIALIFNANNTSVTVNTVTDGRTTIILDAGHGGLDSGCIGIGGELEKEINLAIVKNLQQLLEFSGFNTVLTRDSDDSIHSEGVTGIRNQKVSDMENRKAIIDAYPGSLFFSVHQNLYTDSAYYGAQMFYTEMNSENYKLALILQDCFYEIQDGNDREVKLIENELFLFKATSQPAVLIECGFLSNPDDADRLSDADYQKKVAFAIYKGIMRYINAEQSPDNIENNDSEIILQMQ